MAVNMIFRAATLSLFIFALPAFAAAQELPSAPQSRADAVSSAVGATEAVEPITRRYQPLPYTAPEGVSTRITDSSLNVATQPSTRVTTPQSTTTQRSQPVKTSKSYYPGNAPVDGGRRIVCEDGPLLGGLTGGRLNCGPEGSKPRLIDAAAAIEASQEGALRIHRNGTVTYTEAYPEYRGASVVYGIPSGAVERNSSRVVTVGETRVVDAPNAFRPVRRESLIE